MCCNNLFSEQNWTKVELALEQNFNIFQLYFLFNIFRKSKKKPWKKGQPTCFFTKEKAYQYQIICPKLTRSFRRIQKISKMSLKLTLKNIAVLCNMGVAQPKGLPRPFFRSEKNPILEFQVLIQKISKMSLKLNFKKNWSLLLMWAWLKLRGYGLRVAMPIKKIMGHYIAPLVALVELWSFMFGDLE